MRVRVTKICVKGEIRKLVWIIGVALVVFLMIFGIAFALTPVRRMLTVETASNLFLLRKDLSIICYKEVDLDSLHIRIVMHENTRSQFVFEVFPEWGRMPSMDLLTPLYIIQSKKEGQYKRIISSQAYAIQRDRRNLVKLHLDPEVTVVYIGCCYEEDLYSYKNEKEPLAFYWKKFNLVEQ